MIKYNFKVEVPFLDKTNKLAEVKKETVLVVTEERLKQLNDAKVGRVISAEYVEDKTPTKSTKGKNKKEEVVETEGEPTETKVEETTKMIDLEEFRKRVGLSNSSFDEELKEVELAAIEDLKMSGIHESNIVASNTVVCQAITAYVRANFRNNKQSDKYQKSYERLRYKMSVSSKYKNPPKEV